MTTQTELTKTEFISAISDALVANRSTLGGMTIDPDKAWAAYAADPERWHKVTEDNPAGHVGAAFVLAEGDWWIAR